MRIEKQKRQRAGLAVPCLSCLLRLVAVAGERARAAQMRLSTAGRDSSGRSPDDARCIQARRSEGSIEVTDPTCPRRVWTALFLFLVATGPCVETSYATQRQDAADSTVSASTPAMRWQAWRATTDMPLTAAQAAQRTDLIRHVEEMAAVRRIEETFPLAGDLLDGRTFWAAVVLLESYWPAVLVWERTGSGWREVAGHRLGYDVGAVAPVRVEPTHAWMIAKGRSGARGLPSWEVLRFDGESVKLEIHGGWSDVMLVDVDLDGTLEILGEESATSTATTVA